MSGSESMPDGAGSGGVHPARVAIAAVRGAVQVESNTAEAILAATSRLLATLLADNRLEPGSIVSALFTATADLDADFPAHAARRLGWSDVPLLCAREIEVRGAMPRVVRVLLTVTGVEPGVRLAPAYLDGAAALRPDIAVAEPRSDVGPATPRSAIAPAAPRQDIASIESPAGRSERRRRVALVGLGQIGGSIGLALGRGGWTRVGFDHDAEARERARHAGAIDEVASTVADACAGAEVAVIATPVDTLAALIDEAAVALPRGAALLDTGSARSGVTDALRRAVGRGVRAVGGHPLAGREGHGLAAARRDLFAGTRFALLDAGAGVPEIVLELVAALGAEPIEVAPEDHDRSLARTSHVPYLVACALEALGAEAAGRGLSGPGFRDMTRLAASEPRMALAYCRANAEEILTAWRELRGALDARVTALR